MQDNKGSNLGKGLSSLLKENNIDNIVDFSETKNKVRVLQNNYSQCFYGRKRLQYQKIATANADRSYNQNIGIILMGYISNIFMFPIPKFISEIKKIDIDGVLVVDAPHELKEENTLREGLNKNKIDFIKLVAPTTPDERLKKICEIGSGYIYCLNYSGTSGIKSANLNQVKDLVKKIKKHTNLPVCSGFGIKTPNDAKEIASTGVEGVIVGTTLVDYIEKNLNDTNLSKNLGKKIKEFTNKLN